MTDKEKKLQGKVALVAGATRGAGRAIAVALGSAGATVYCTGRTTRSHQSDIGRSETIEETAEQVTAAGGKGIAVQVDHSKEAEVKALVERINTEQNGQLDILINDIWGGEKLIEWGKFWELSMDKGLLMLERAIFTHIITSRCAVPLMIARGKGLVIEITDGDSDKYRGNLIYDLAKVSVIRLAKSMAIELEPTGLTAFALTPGFLRSEQMLDYFGVAEANWRDAIAKEPYFEASETPYYIGQAVVALATDPDIHKKNGQALATWHLSVEYGFKDADGSQPHWWNFYTAKQAAEGKPI
ncbi:MAG: SDR family NAD(P)-dependent oxidoreductase [Chloroflexi bacterium]|nr:SDR family NAD(P)-dependent oxidoreductase [Chloroflexota bacterium]MCC6891362.1 SDR family NAD(P)-dependent oxidoreductase [Anaerolineae bacterium]